MEWVGATCKCRSPTGIGIRAVPTGKTIQIPRGRIKMPTTGFADAVRLEDSGATIQVPWSCCALCYKSPQLNCPYAVVTRDKLIAYGAYVGRRNMVDLFLINNNLIAVKNLTNARCVAPPKRGNVDFGGILCMYMSWDSSDKVVLIARVCDGTLHPLHLRKGHLYVEDAGLCKLPANAVLLSGETVVGLQMPMHISAVVFSWLYYFEKSN
mgnify:CR=1 FL=1